MEARRGYSFVQIHGMMHSVEEWNHDCIEI